MIVYILYLVFVFFTNLRSTGAAIDTRIFTLPREASTVCFWVVEESQRRLPTEAIILSRNEP